MFCIELADNIFGQSNSSPAGVIEFMNVVYLFGRKASVVYTVIALVFIFLGTLTGNDFVWELTDMFNNLIVLPNALALFAMTGKVVAMLKEGQQSKLNV